jgi:CTP:molybdopterin cytidylyltransferase MocA
VASFDVIVPAGGKIDAEFAEVVGTSSKALISFNERTMLARTLDTLRGSGLVNRIVVVGSHEVREHPDAQAADLVLEEGSSGPDNILRGLNALGETDEVLIVTSDLPFLSEQGMRDFVGKCRRGEGIDFHVPLIAQHEFADQFPGTTATFVRLKDGCYTTGCAYLATGKGLRQAIEHIEQVFQRRKSKLGMARLLGFRFVFELLTRRLTVPAVEKKVMDILGCRGAAVPNSPAELAFDIDYLDDYRYSLERFRS